MTLVNHGFNGSLDEASFAQMMGIEGAEGVDGSAAWAVTQGAGRQVSVAASSGWAAAAGVSSKDDTGAITASLSTPAAGQWYLITRRIDWSAHTCTVQAIAHTTTSTTIPTVAPTTYPTYNLTPGTLYDQPLAWAWVRNTDTTMALFDLRTLPARVRLAVLETPAVEPADFTALAALAGSAGTFKSVVEGGARFLRVAGVWVQQTTAIFATASARDTAYAKASAAYLVAGAMSRLLTERFDRRYNGTTWKPYGSGLFPVIPTSVAGTGASIAVDGAVVVSSGGSSVSINGCAGADFDNYAVIGKFTLSTGATISLRLRASGTDAAGATDYTHETVTKVGAALTAAAASGTSAPIANLTVSDHRIKIDLFNPADSEATYLMAADSAPNGAAHAGATLDGRHILTTAYDGITFIASAGTITAAIIRICGYND